MKRLGIIQPGRIGDIIICLPIARWYADRGYEVIWPVAKYVYDNFADYVDYVNFIPTPDLDCAHAHNILVGRCNHIIDLSITFPSGNIYNDSIYLSPGNTTSFDRLKYQFADVPFEEKYNLQFTRIRDRENKLFDSVVGQDTTPYTLVHLEGSSFTAQWISHEDERVICIKAATGSIFDWSKVIEKANKIVMVDSCMANLVEQTQLNLSAPRKILIRDPNIVNHYRNIWSV